MSGDGSMTPQETGEPMVAALEGFGSKPTTEEARLTDFVMGKKEVPEEKRDIGERRESWESPSGGVRYFIFFKRAVDDTVDSVRPHSIRKGPMMF